LATDRTPDPPDRIQDGIQSTSASSVSKVLHYVIGGILLTGGIAYWVLKPPTLNPMADPRAAEALALVQTHRATQAPTILHALTNRVKRMAERGQGVRLGEWKVEKRQDNLYIVRIFIREEGTRQWFERDYVWRVNVATKSVAPLTVAASDLMPSQPIQPNPMAAPALLP
jgi:hypothetical protein